MWRTTTPSSSDITQRWEDEVMACLNMSHPET